MLAKRTQNQYRRLYIERDAVHGNARQCVLTESNLLAGIKIGPSSVVLQLGKIQSAGAVRGLNRRHQYPISKHELIRDIVDITVVGKIKYHGPLHGKVMVLDSGKTGINVVE